VRRIVACLLLFVPLVAAGCGSRGSTTSSTRATSTQAQAPTMLTVFRVRGGDLHAESVTVPHTTAVAEASLGALGLSAPVTIANGTARVQLSNATADQVAEIVYTLTQFPSVQRVDVGGRTGLARGDVASYVPPILIESPGDGATVAGSFHVSGSASVFEATLVVELVVDGKIAVRKTVTASEGAPSRGTFDTVVHAPGPGSARVVAFSPSAENGLPQHQVEAPVTVVS
jgi:hypothetical protein